MGNFILALDQGTTSSRAILFDRGGRVAAMAQQTFPQHYPQPGWVEHDPLELWESQRSVAAQALRKVLAKFAEVELLVQIGEYKKGSDKEADDALARINAVNAFLRQGLDEKSTFEETLQALYKVVA